jgi:hypothetical protein
VPPSDARLLPARYLQRFEWYADVARACPAPRDGCVRLCARTRVAVARALNSRWVCFCSWLNQPLRLTVPEALWPVAAEVGPYDQPPAGWRWIPLEGCGRWLRQE